LIAGIDMGAPRRNAARTRDQAVMSGMGLHENRAKPAYDDMLPPAKSPFVHGISLVKRWLFDSAHAGEVRYPDP
jgi:hypothetical protein